ncbi:hypothetical protein CAPTEDRAFT_209975 [Capitella teleta]|uniref:THAP-type domain-containing protein n=1 Tax=Capitella teleta TaxID=283909 RepID=R7V894_CAPTE|nr:hypothetical protein CAPTEDRAFT_209975 [Capitella teleta]|eukprot:ELU14754.1 hypothetical protein CAPTEDRAFT_209975 [Capitella teleta]
MANNSSFNERKASKSYRYCNAINCGNRSERDIDDRTRQYVRFHRFPNPQSKLELCLKWITNCRRGDLDLKNVKHKYLCSTHFKTSAYACPTDIAQSSLMEGAVPTVFHCPKPPPSRTPKRPPPRKRLRISPTKKKKRLPDAEDIPNPDAQDIPNHTGQDEVSSQLDASPMLPPSPAPRHFQNELDSANKKLALVQKDLTTLRSVHYIQTRKVNRLQDRLKRKEQVELELRRELEAVKDRLLNFRKCDVVVDS